MIDPGAAARYAKSLLVMAAAKGAVDAVEEELSAFAQAYSTTGALREYLMNPRIPARSKLAAVDRICRGRVHPLTAAFVALVVKRRRAPLIPEMSEAFHRMADKHRGVLRARVRAFGPLSGAQLEALRRQASRLSGASRVEVAVEEDPSLLGGLSLAIQDTLVDGSLASKLGALRERLGYLKRE